MSDEEIRVNALYTGTSPAWDIGRPQPAFLHLAESGALVDTVLDCGLFHIFDDADRARYVESLRAVVAPAGRYHLLCFSDRMPGAMGPRRITQDEIRASFADGWRVESIEPATLEITVPIGPAVAWLAAITRVADDGKKARTR